MVTLQQLTDDVNSLKTKVDIIVPAYAALKAQLANAPVGLSAEDQALVDAADAEINALTQHITEVII